jgi:hypothetical protein
VIQLGLILALVTSLLVAGTWLVHSIKEDGRNECRAEHAEAARMAELRSRERIGADRERAKKRELEIAPRVAAVVASAPVSCLSDDALSVLRDDANQYSPRGVPKAGGADSR